MLMVIIVGCLAGLVLYPAYSDYQLIKELGVDDDRQQLRAEMIAKKRAETSPATLRRLAAALDTTSDRRFLSIHSVLRRLGKFRVPGRNPIWFDRLNCLELEQAFIPQEASGQDFDLGSIRRRIVVKLLLSGRDNRYIRRALRKAVKDSDPAVRGAAGTLGARIGDDDALRELLEDPDFQVVATAALDAGTAGRSGLAEPIARLLDRYVTMHRTVFSETKTSETQNLPSSRLVKLREVVSCAAYALARLRPKQYSLMLCDLARQSTHPELRDRLLVILGILNDNHARQAVMDIIHAARWEKPFAPAMALEAAVKMKLREAGIIGMEVLIAAAKGDKNLLESQVIGALNLAAALKHPVRREVHEICRNLWCPNRSALLVRAARMLGVQASSDKQLLPGAPTREACLQTLREAVQYAFWTAPPSGRPQTIATPLPSASAAVALWLLEPSVAEFQPTTNEKFSDDEDTETSAFYIRQAVVGEGSLGGDYVAWNLGLSGNRQAFALGRSMLPGPKDPIREYDPEVRSTGAMLMVLSARGDKQRDQAARWITEHLWSEEFPARGAFLCALLMGGRNEYLHEVRNLLEIPEFPSIRALRALLAGGDKTTLDWLLWDVNEVVRFPLEDLPFMLTGLGMNEVFAATAAELPRPSAAASTQTQLWEVRIMRSVYGIRRSAIRVGLAK